LYRFQKTAVLHLRWSQLGTAGANFFFSRKNHALAHVRYLFEKIQDSGIIIFRSKMIEYLNLS
jgi:hypothetical protein